MSYHHFCRNPKCKARFSKTDMTSSRRVPDLVDMATLDVYYVANPAKAVNRSPDRVCPDCGRLRNVKPPTWLPDHLCVYALFPPLILWVHLCFSWFTFVFFVATPRLAATTAAASDTDVMSQEPDARNMYGPRCFFVSFVSSSASKSV